MELKADYICSRKKTYLWNDFEHDLTDTEIQIEHPDFLKNRIVFILWPDAAALTNLSVHLDTIIPLYL